MQAPMIITGTLGMDAHIIGTKILSRALKENGFRVTALGAYTPPEEFIKAAQETKADAILMSSLYGMAEFDLKGFNEKRLEAGLGKVILYIGGNLMVGRHEHSEVEEKFKKLGFDRVYPPDADLEAAIKDLKEDLKARGKML
jgi:methylaspartate mutase S subunit